MNNKQKNIIVSGFGGQGVLFLGTIISQAAILEGKNTTFIPSYGAEMRGGSANCYVVVSEDEIASPIFDEGDFGIFLSKQALEKFQNRISKEGLVIADSSMTGEDIKRGDLKYFFKPFNDLIVGGNQKLLLNIVVLGAVIKKTGILMKENVLKALEKVSSMKKPEFLDLNIKSFEYGWSLV
ncbi:MAG: 2-oxoacid:acceptor oxidoreductase family protein [Candidatus Gastranaerophilales bacterium]|nr:2-oxoacid:acceptor oxidoreductase family protein [Candidatus Gastranaerophilales bacterium]